MVRRFLREDRNVAEYARQAHIHPYAYAANNPVNATDPWGNCDSTPILGGLCNAAQAAGNAANAAIGAGLRALNGTPWGHALLVTINNFDNSDLSHSVIGDLQGVLAGAQQALSEAKACVQNAVACGKLALALALYVSLHPGDVLRSAVAAQLGNLNQIRQEIDCGRYGLAAGHLLVGFVTTFGPAKLGELLKGLAAGGDAEAVVSEALTVVTGCGCFPGDTGVATPHGLVAIANIQVGDQVLSEDPQTGKVEPERVQAVIDDGVKPTMAVGLSDGSSLRVTTNHPFYVDSGPGISAAGWIQAGDLKVGDRVRTKDGQGITIASLRYHTGEAHVYTLTVDQDHDFFVGTARVLVHNTSCRIWQLWRGKFPQNAASDGVLVRRDPATGAISHYAVYDKNGVILYRVDLLGPPHGGIPTPHVHYYHYNFDSQGVGHLIEDPQAYAGTSWQLTPPR